jgi:RNA polymerase sigma factor (sigma-70 family)
MIISTNTLPACVVDGPSVFETRDGIEYGLPVFLSMRPRLFGIAYRILGRAADAEDIVQDVWLRWQSTKRSAVLDPPAFLATTATRLAINLAQSARSRRETYVGSSPGEPVDTSADPGLGAERGEALNLAIVALLEKLSPTERAAYVLREAFDYPYRHIADILQKKEADVRQLVSRARKHVADGRHTPVHSDQQRRFLETFIAAAQKGDTAALEGFLAEDAVSCSMVGLGPRHETQFLPAGVSQSHCRRRRFKFLEFYAAHPSPDKWTGSRSHVVRWSPRRAPGGLNLSTRHRSDHVDPPVREPAWSRLSERARLRTRLIAES